jgi:hypothetical protein
MAFSGFELEDEEIVDVAAAKAKARAKAHMHRP